MRYKIQVAFKNQSGNLQLLEKEFTAESTEEALKQAKKEFPYQGVIFSDPKEVKNSKGINIGTQIGGTIINLDSVSNIRIGD